MAATRNAAAFAALIAILGAATACYAPRRVNQIVGNDQQVKIVYQTIRGETGIVQCARGDDGSLKDCKELTVEFLKKGE